MANYANLIASVQQSIKQNGNQEITGALLQQNLVAMINELGVGYQFMGIATPDGVPGTPDYNVCYFALTAGTYVNYGGIQIGEGESALIKYNGTWSKDTLGFATTEELQATSTALEDLIKAVRENSTAYDLVSVTPTIDAGKRVYNGQVQDATTVDIYKYAVVPGNVYAFSGRFSSGFTLSFLHWFDANGNYLSTEPYRGQSSASTTYTKQIVSAPENAAYAYVNVQKTQAQNSAFYSAQDVISLQSIYETVVSALLTYDIADDLETDDPSKVLSARQGYILNEAVEFLKNNVIANIFDVIQPTAVTESTHFRDTGEIASSSYTDLYKYVVTPGNVYAFSGRKHNQISDYFVCWVDANNVLIKMEPYKGPTQAGVATLYERQIITAPDGAAFALVNVQKSDKSYCDFYSVTPESMQNISDNTAMFLRYMGAEILPYFVWNNVFSTVGKHAAIRVVPGEQYIITSHESESTDYNYSRYAFATSKEYASGESVPLVVGTSVNIIPKGESVVITIPDGCQYLLVNTSIAPNLPLDIRRDTSSASKKNVRILLIGNSYSEDAFAYVPYIIKDLGVDCNAVVGILMQSSTTVSDHVSNFENQTAAYDFFFNNAGNGAWTKEAAKKTIQWALTNYAWDVIVTHQSSTAANDYATKYQPYINRLINDIYTVITYPVKFGWMLSQVRPAVTNGGANRTEATILQYYNYTAADSQRLINETLMDIIIPVGTAIQNARTLTALKSLGAYSTNANNTSGYGYLCNSDGVHLQEGIPCQIAAYSVVLAILRICGIDYKSVFGEQTRVTSAWASDKSIPHPHGAYINATDENCRLGQMCAIMAEKHPFVVTDMNYIVNPS